MHHERHNTHINGVLIIIAILVVGGILWYLIASSGDTYTATPTDTTVGVVEGKEVLYQNEAYDFSLRYDNRLVLTEGNPEQLWKYGSTLPGTRLATLDVPTELFPNTNFAGAFISIGVSEDNKAVLDCLIASENEVGGEITKEGFSTFTATEAGAGNFYEIESLRTVRDGACMVLERVIHSTNIGNYDPESGITEYDRSVLLGLLKRVAASFHFNN